MIRASLLSKVHEGQMRLLVSVCLTNLYRVVSSANVGEQISRVSGYYSHFWMLQHDRICDGNWMCGCAMLRIPCCWPHKTLHLSSWRLHTLVFWPFGEDDEGIS